MRNKIERKALKVRVSQTFSCSKMRFSFLLLCHVEHLNRFFHFIQSSLFSKSIFFTCQHVLASWKARIWWAFHHEVMLRLINCKSSYKKKKAPGIHKEPWNNYNRTMSLETAEAQWQTKEKRNAGSNWRQLKMNTICLGLCVTKTKTFANPAEGKKSQRG